MDMCYVVYKYIFNYLCYLSLWIACEIPLLLHMYSLVWNAQNINLFYVCIH